MSDEIAATERTGEPDGRGGVISPLLFYRSDHPGLLVAGAFLLTMALMLISRQIGQVEVGDSSIWDYLAQSIQRGQIPYRDVVEIKLPGSAYLSAAAMWAGKWLGLRDLIAVRLLNVALVGALSAVACLVAELYVSSRPVAIISFLIPLTSGRFIVWMSGGTEPRLTMILFGMLTLLLIAKDRPFLAGFSSALSFLCWQPGLLFTGTAFLVFSRYLSTWRDLRAAKVLAGAAVPVAATFLYFAHLGAWRELWTWTFAYTFDVYGPKGFRGILGGAYHIWNASSRVLGPGVLFLVAGLVGYVMLLWSRVSVRTQIRQRLSEPGDLFKDSLLIAPLVYFVFCLIDFKSANYLIPALPFAGIFAGWALVKAGQFLAASTCLPTFVSAEAIRWLPVAVILVLALATAISYGISGDRGLEAETQQFKAMAELLTPTDQIYTHGSTEILVLLDRPNLNPYVFLDSGKDNYIAARTSGGFGAIIDQMESRAPRVVVLSRLGVVAHRQDLETWVKDHYEKLQFNGYDIYLRRP